MVCIRKRATVGLEAETELTTKPHFDDIVCETYIGEGSLVSSSSGRSEGTTSRTRR